MSVQLFQCKDVILFNSLISQKDLRQALITETGGGEAFIQRAIDTITQLVIHTSVGKEEPLLAELRKLGYSELQITTALAQAWLNETDTFVLPKIALQSKFQKKGGIIALSIAITCFIATIFIFGFRQVFPEFIGALLAFPPLMAPPATIIYLIVHWLLKRISFIR